MAYKDVSQSRRQPAVVWGLELQGFRLHLRRWLVCVRGICSLWCERVLVAFVGKRASALWGCAMGGCNSPALCSIL